MKLITTGNTMRYLIFLTLLVSLSLHAGAIKKWVDEEGNVHYGDAPPRSAKTEGVRIQSAPSDPGPPLPRASSKKNSKKSNSSNTAAKDPAVPDDQAKIACDQATEDLRVINRSSRIKLRAADGSTRYLSSEEIEERKNQAQADIDQFCQ